MLNAKGVQVSAPTVGAVMREQGLRAVRTRAWKQTTVQDPQAKTAHIRNHMLGVTVALASGPLITLKAGDALPPRQQIPGLQ